MKKTNILIIIFVCFMLSGCSNEPSWHTVKTGTIEKIEYLEGSYTEPSKTFIYFTDGSIYIFYRSINIPSKKVIIQRNQYGGNERIIKND